MEALTCGNEMKYTDGLFAQTQPQKCEQLRQVLDMITACQGQVRCAQPLCRQCRAGECAAS